MKLSGHTVVLLAVLLLWACAPVVVPPAPSSQSEDGLPATQEEHRYQDLLLPALRMTVGRAVHTATLLPDGKVLIAGGFRQEGMREISIASAELFDPLTKSFTAIGDMKEARSGHTATLLPNGKVLIAGGWGPSQRHASAELYDPQTGQFLFTAALSAPRAGMTATLLRDGRVLLVGGESAGNQMHASAEIYEPQSGRFVQAGTLKNGRTAHTATLLDNGNVLIAGGHAEGNVVLSSAEIYEVAQGVFLPTGDLMTIRHKHAAVLLHDGNVLVVGGSNQEDWLGQYASAELYDAATGRFRQAATLNNERFKLADAALVLGNGNVLIAGGNRQMELFDAQSQRFVASKELDDHYYSTVLTRLQQGSVLITGGYDQGIKPTNQAWIYQ